MFFLGNTIYMFELARVFSVKIPKRGTVSPEAVRAEFSLCDDLTERRAAAGAGPAEAAVLWLDGLTDARAVSEEILSPLYALRCRSEEELRRRALRGGICRCAVRERLNVRETAGDIAAGCAAVILPALGTALTFEVKTSQVRSVEAPTVEKSVLGPKEAFVETLRTNTALVRRRLPSPALKCREFTPDAAAPGKAALLYMEGIAPADRVETAAARLAGASLPFPGDPGALERQLAGRPGGAFPRTLHTERPDSFARGLLEGKVGILTDGLPVGFLLPGTLPEMLRTREDDARHAAVARALTLLRWAALVLSLTLPAVYVAAAMYHQEMIPQKLLLSVIRAKEEVPFSTAAEVLGMLFSFELLQEAGVRLPDPAGQTVSIIGALIVGQSAVEAKVLSPIVIIVVAMAGIGGFAQPSQELGAAVRLWRFGLVLCAAVLGLFGLAAGLLALLWRLCGTETLGVCFLYPLCDAPARKARQAVLRSPSGEEEA